MSEFDKELEGLAPNKTISFMLQTGEEVITQVREVKGDVIKLVKPRKVITHMEIDPQNGQQHMRMGLVPMFNTDNVETFAVSLRLSMIAAIQIPAAEAAKGYEAQTSSIIQ